MFTDNVCRHCLQTLFPIITTIIIIIIITITINNKRTMFQSNLTTPEKPVLVLRVCQSTGHSRNNFYWPQSGPVNCPDWADNKECGNGLHGWLHGVGNGYDANGRLLKNVNSLWLVVEVPSYIDLGGKIKFPSGTVVFSGTQEGLLSTCGIMMS